MRQPRAKRNAVVGIQNDICDSCDHSDDYSPALAFWIAAVVQILAETVRP